MSLKPFFSFFGGKWRAAPRYPAPKHDTIVEPFAGSAGYSVRHAEHNVILIERDPVIAELWRYLIAAQPDEIAALPLLRANDHVDQFGLAPGARSLIGFYLQKGAAAPGRSPGSWMRKAGEARFHQAQYWGPGLRDRIASQVGAIKHWRIVEGSYVDCSWDFPATWFIDPPYQVHGKHYRYSNRQIDFTALGDWCRARRGQVIVCEQVGATWLPFTPVPFLVQCTSGAQKGARRYSPEAWWLRDTQEINQQ